MHKCFFNPSIGRKMVMRGTYNSLGGQNCIQALVTTSRSLSPNQWLNKGIKGLLSSLLCEAWIKTQACSTFTGYWHNIVEEWIQDADRFQYVASNESLTCHLI